MTEQGKMAPEVWSLRQAEHDLQKFLEAPQGGWSGPDEWFRSYGQTGWAAACNAHIPVTDADKVSTEFLRAMREALLQVKAERSPGEFDFHAARAMRQTVAQHYVDPDAFEASASSPDFWTLLSVYIVPDVILWRWNSAWEAPYALKTGESGATGAVADRYCLGDRRNTLVRDTLGRIWWKMELTQESCRSYGPAAFGPTPAEWQERPSLFAYRTVAEHVASGHGAGNRPAAGDTEWAAEYGFLFSYIHPEYADLDEVDRRLGGSGQENTE